jgi:hypothetical protein
MEMEVYATHAFFLSPIGYYSPATPFLPGSEPAGGYSPHINYTMKTIGMI